MQQEREFGGLSQGCLFICEQEVQALDGMCRVTWNVPEVGGLGGRARDGEDDHSVMVVEKK